MIPKLVRQHHGEKYIFPVVKLYYKFPRYEALYKLISSICHWKRLDGEAKVPLVAPRQNDKSDGGMAKMFP